MFVRLWKWLSGQVREHRIQLWPYVRMAVDAVAALRHRVMCLSW